MRVLEDTIIAIATPPGFGGLGIVRLSGPSALAAARHIFEPKTGKKRPVPDRRPVFGSVRDPETGRPLDEAFLTYFKGPRSYTGEDVVEISTHGSPAVLEAVLRAGTGAGTRLARPGEFTLRAYLHGRLDILQAQAVDDLIRSVSLAQARVSSRQLCGSLSKRVHVLRTRLVVLISRIEAGLEFPDDGLRTNPAADRKVLDALIQDIGRLVASYETGKALAEGVTLAIVGRTNVGKSTLFNALLEEDRAIVTPFPGTTRDFLRERLLLDGVVFHLVDMAGLGRASHPVESRGIAKGRRIARDADGLLIILDASRPATDEDERLLRRYPAKKALIVLNKSDLPKKLSERRVRELAGATPVVAVSALKGRGMDKLRACLSSVFAPAAGREEELVLHARQRDGLQGILESLRRARALLEKGHSEEIYAEEIRTALRLIGELTGEVRTEEVLEDIFGRFCVGK
jgi:tRNA modification GTPase